MTSANTVKYIIYDRSGKEVGTLTQNHYCRTKWQELCQYTPLEEHSIRATWEDEEENEHEDEIAINLKAFLEANGVKATHEEFHCKEPEDMIREIIQRMDEGRKLVGLQYIRDTHHWRSHLESKWE